jgi:hypothetical protein
MKEMVTEKLRLMQESAGSSQSSTTVDSLIKVHVIQPFENQVKADYQPAEYHAPHILSSWSETRSEH